ncbi:helix-turn-helix domain-containing protein [Paracoccus marcusii]|uniref:helix-turn-helix domain-containing protein n=1 Tax=Paracoccus marcusii TaxID=59779 RepID=UPI002491E5DE|nr:helix-turn-helix domain-containing protein [Paracoccus marcusii]
MSKVSMAKAAKMFEVSRPTLAKHHEQGKISGVKVGDAWEFDISELARVYTRRGAKPATPSPDLHADLPDVDRGTAGELQAEIRVLQAKLEAAERLAEERGRHLDDLRRLLPKPEDQAPAPAEAQRQGFWSRLFASR